jgi:hypothetical protein
MPTCIAVWLKTFMYLLEFEYDDRELSASLRRGKRECRDLDRGRVRVIVRRAEERGNGQQGISERTPSRTRSAVTMSVEIPCPFRNGGVRLRPL